MDDTVAGLLMLGVSMLFLGTYIAMIVSSRRKNSKHDLEHYGEDWLDGALQRRELRDLTRQAFMNMTEHVETKRRQPEET